MKLLSSIIRFWHRCVLAIIVEDVRRTEAKFTELEAVLESGLIHLRTSQQKALAAETVRLNARINHIEAGFKAELARIDAELMKHIEAVVFLSNTKRDGAGLR